ncbi:MAG: hypothetical protein KKH93_03295 [Candidatus Omnitrophica bacterium]|nr:hypothetical protein [Candidatus Omnitrophota bacterium]MBU2044382.1 hypothetical protein [Candidatus Omnitrophota bacterium]MBU2251080.1 hypothetical protein [Candidatus Omnitrophota bacterium]MBU2266378.1 hypothetical protein [Candidatus Omnitrophota bacterium]MBU2473844.1 hypothetical protein [Candidatus Omnitrophota bacterium]
MAKKRVIYLFLLAILIWLSRFSVVSGATVQEEPGLNPEKEDNPFLDYKTEQRYEDKDRRMVKDMTLTAVFYSGETSRAIIDGRIVKKGDIVNNLEITEIKSEKVYFVDYSGKECTLEMQDILSAIDVDESRED